jgi:hypothetical protein
LNWACVMGGYLRQDGKLRGFGRLECLAAAWARLPFARPRPGLVHGLIEVGRLSSAPRPHSRGTSLAASSVALGRPRDLRGVQVAEDPLVPHRDNLALCRREEVMVLVDPVGVLASANPCHIRAAEPCLAGRTPLSSGTGRLMCPLPAAGVQHHQRVLQECKKPPECKNTLRARPRVQVPISRYRPPAFKSG